MRQEDFRKLFKEKNDPLRAKILPYDFAGESILSIIHFSLSRAIYNMVCTF
jgi:hypothetical protein